MTVRTEPINADVLRLRHEFIDLPGLRLTVDQVARLLGVSLARADDLVEELVLEGFLEPDDSGPARYGRPGIVHESRTEDEPR